jgi:hypothetical protein
MTTSTHPHTLFFSRTVNSVHETPDNLGHNKKRGEWVFQVNTPRRVYYLLANSEANMQ